MNESIRLQTLLRPDQAACDRDWSRDSERRATLEGIPGVKLEVVKMAVTSSA